ncbi:precorrin-6Y C5,15-methyltransferase (decarboxylating) subunit CbiT [Selenomonas sp. KH1T6]|uniref:precorrin-6Y C5,15-methyltransferase (decarboxylating) subunit CbiT n=1 Tax=Selenomonas sp. KH1T6 TaxID=3158784 RepID=UPI0008A72AA5|nr:cobalt-precorrin 7 C15-methyltransferase [Selenomonas ruminantium]
MDYLGIDDEEFIRGKVPMTKKEIRILSLVNARLAPDSLVYDIGAGTGAISVEAARLVPKGRVYALERNPEAITLIRANAANFALRNITVINEEAPEGIAALPKCDAVFVGGSGGRLVPILDAVAMKLKSRGRIVVNCITVQSLMQAIEYFRSRDAEFSYETIQVQVTHLQQIGPYDMAKAVNPVYILTAQKWDKDQNGLADMNEKAV